MNRLSRCSVSSLSLSTLSINSDDSSLSHNPGNSLQSSMRSLSKNSLGSSRCHNLAALAQEPNSDAFHQHVQTQNQQFHQQQQQHGHDQINAMSMNDGDSDFCNDDVWGFFIDATPSSHTLGGAGNNSATQLPQQHHVQGPGNYYETPLRW